MEVLDKESFLLLLKTRPQLLIGRQMIYDGNTVGIIDVSLSGDYLHLEGSSSATKWVPASCLEDRVVIDKFTDDTRNSGSFTVHSITKSMERLEKLVGQPDSDHPKSLFEIVSALNKELLHLRLRIEEMESKEVKK